jgi:hypothetical protein
MLRAPLLLAACVMVSSCATVRLYPVCFFDPTQPDSAIKSRHVDVLTKTLRRFDENANATEDGRWIVAKTTWISHEELQRVWPRLGCVGTVTSGTEVKRSADCTEFVAEQLKSGEYRIFDIKSDDVVLSDEAPGRPHVICWRSASR